jgi:hypothetical protein
MDLGHAFAKTKIKEKGKGANFCALQKDGRHVTGRGFKGLGGIYDFCHGF